MTQLIAIEKIKTDGGTQARAALNDDVVAEYAEAIIGGADMPAVTVFHDGKSYWLADGFHRFHAHRHARTMEIDADIKTGTKRDAILYSVGANAYHGLRRSNADKRAAVRVLLKDKEWSKWSDRQIADACGVGHPFVAAVRDPERAAKQKENRKVSGARETQLVNQPVQVESDSIEAPKPAPLSHSDEQKKSEPAPTAPINEAVETAEQDHPGPDLAELVDELQAENTRLTQLLSVAEADDLVAEATKWRKAYDRAVVSQSEAMDSAHASQKREKYSMTQLRRCGKAVGVEDPRKIAAAVESMAKAVVA